MRSVMERLLFDTFQVDIQHLGGLPSMHPSVSRDYRHNSASEVEGANFTGLTLGTFLEISYQEQRT